MNELTGPHQISANSQFKCTTCHDAQGTLSPQSAKELCLSCHTGSMTSNWHSSIHEEAGLICIDCHIPHPSISQQASEGLKLRITEGVPRPMYASQTQACLPPW